MQLVKKSLRYLQDGKYLINTLLTLQRHYSNQVDTVALSSDVFDGPKTDASVPPLITMHGLFGSKQNWRGISKALVQKTNRRIYTVDARNHGESPHTGTHGSRTMAGDVAAFMNSRSISKACLMGHSMGGRTMMYFALTYPQLTERLIVVDISPVSIPRDFTEMARIFDAMLNLNVSSNLTIAEGRKVAKEQLMQATDSNETVDFIMLNLKKHPDNGAFYWGVNVPVLRESLSGFATFEDKLKDLAPYSGPTTFICGQHSPFMKPEHWSRVQNYFPSANIHWLDAGHLVHFDQPQQFIGIVSDFLS